MVRQSLDPDATYGDVVVHGNGMAGLQWRARKGEDTNTFDLPIEGPGTFTIRLVRTGVRIYMFIGRNGAALKEIAHTEVSFQNPVLVGLFVSSHDAAKSETVIFSDVTVEPQPAEGILMPDAQCEYPCHSHSRASGRVRATTARSTWPASRE